MKYKDNLPALNAYLATIEDKATLGHIMKAFMAVDADVKESTYWAIISLDAKLDIARRAGEIHTEEQAVELPRKLSEKEKEACRQQGNWRDKHGTAS